MKKISAVCLGLILPFGAVLISPVFAADKSGGDSDHQLIAALYSNEASRFDGLVKLHKVMKQDYQKLLDAGDTDRAEKLKRMIEHCEQYVKSNEEFKDDLAEFAKWHRKLAQKSH